MNAILNILADPELQRTLSWLGGGLTTVAIGLWAVFKFFRTNMGGGRSGKSARTNVGIASTGNVSVGRDLNISKGVPSWVIGLLLVGALLVILRLLSNFAEIRLSDLEQAFANSYLTRVDGDGSTIAIALVADGSVSARRTTEEGAVFSEGRWRRSENGEVCLTLPEEISLSIDPICLRPERADGVIRLIPPDGTGLEWNSEAPDPDLLDPATVAGGAVNITGLWQVEGFYCEGSRVPGSILISYRGANIRADVVEIQCEAAAGISDTTYWRGRFAGPRTIEAQEYSFYAKDGTFAYTSDLTLRVVDENEIVGDRGQRFKRIR